MRILDDDKGSTLTFAPFCIPCTSNSLLLGGANGLKNSMVVEHPTFLANLHFGAQRQQPKPFNMMQFSSAISSETFLANGSDQQPLKNDQLNSFLMLNPLNPNSKSIYFSMLPRVIAEAVGGGTASVDDCIQILRFFSASPQLTWEEKKLIEALIDQITLKFSSYNRTNHSNPTWTSHSSRLKHCTTFPGPAGVDDVFSHMNSFKCNEKIHSVQANSFDEPNSGMKDVPSWLKSLRLHKYASLFGQMSYHEMLALTEEKLAAKGITIGARRKIALSIQKLKDRVIVLKQLEKELIDTSRVPATLNDLRAIISTPIRMKNADQTDDDDIPLHFTNALMRACSYLLSSPFGPHGKIDHESFSSAIFLIDRCLNHEAFVPQQKKKLASLKHEMRRVSAPSSREFRRSSIPFYPHNCQSQFAMQPFTQQTKSPQQHYDLNGQFVSSKSDLSTVTPPVVQNMASGVADAVEKHMPAFSPFTVVAQQRHCDRRSSCDILPASTFSSVGTSKIAASYALNDSTLTSGLIETPQLVSSFLTSQSTEADLDQNLQRINLHRASSLPFWNENVPKFSKHLNGQVDEMNENQSSSSQKLSSLSAVGAERDSTNSFGVGGVSPPSTIGAAWRSSQETTTTIQTTDDRALDFQSFSTWSPFYDPPQTTAWGCSLSKNDAVSSISTASGFSMTLPLNLSNQPIFTAPSLHAQRLPSQLSSSAEFRNTPNVRLQNRQAPVASQSLLTDSVSKNRSCILSPVSFNEQSPIDQLCRSMMALLDV